MATIHKWERYSLVNVVNVEVKSGTLTTAQGDVFYYNTRSTDENTVLSVYDTNGVTGVRLNGTAMVTRTKTTSNMSLASYLIDCWFEHNPTVISSYDTYADYAYLCTTGSTGGLNYSKRAYISKGKGDYVDTVESENASAYPENGVQNSYWYVYAGSEETTGLYATIDGVQRKLTAIPAMVDGVQRELTSLLATVDGVAREIFAAATGLSGVALADIAEGSTVYINENGSPVEFYVACHDYESGLNGMGRTLLVRKSAYSSLQWHSSDVNAYATSDIDSWLNGGYKELLDSEVQTAIGTTSFYYTPGNGDYEVAVLDRAVFLLSLAELDLTASTSYNVEGTALPTASILKTILQWSRTPTTNSTSMAFYLWVMSTMTTVYTDMCTYSHPVRPAFTLPSSAIFDENTMLFKGVGGITFTI